MGKIPELVLRDTWTHQLSEEDREKVQRFLQGMLDRMSVSHHKYGPLATKFPHLTAGIANSRRALNAYTEDDNLEHMMDAANYCLIEFMHPSQPAAHFRSTDSSESLGYITNDGEIIDGRTLS